MPALNFKGKSIVRTHHLTVPYRQLKPNAKKSLTKSKPNLSDNLIIHGDNLLALKALLPSFSGKVKCIYIDPPYNTGNENWVYNDNVNSPMHAAWLKSVVDKEDLTRHDKWLCMMWPRLVLLRELLREDGVIFISIDDNEVHHLRAVMDEIFGEENFISAIVWQRKRGRDNSAKFFSKSHEYALCYARNESVAQIYNLEMTASAIKAYRNPDNDPRGNYRLLGVWSRGTQGGSRFAFRNKNGKNFSERLWLVNAETMKRLEDDNRLVFVGDKVYRKLFLTENEGSVPETIWDDASNAANAADEIKMIFGEQIFETPKPVPYIKRMLEIATEEDDI
ncbi:MAG: site-specific DNA-methyltransferase, partial [Anaerolineales bacterium]|nr:site-specific DNA-methyltransferase [Anaerolineales bacterium]